MSGAALERITSALEARGCRLVRRGEHQVMAQCPAHEDTNPSLSVRASETRARIHCFAGCEDIAVLEALGLAVRDFYDAPRGRDLASYVYTDAVGATTRTVHRREGKKFRQSGDTGATPTLYRLPQVIGAVAGGREVYLVEGEEDVHAVEAAGGVATTAPQGASSFAKVDVTPLMGARVIVVPDQDAAGSKWLAAVRRRLDGVVEHLEVRVPLVGKDVDDHLVRGYDLDALAVVEDIETVKGSEVPGTASEPGTAVGDGRNGSAVPGSRHRGREPGTDDQDAGAPRYFDVAALLDGGLPDAPPTDVLARTDGVCLFYAGQVNLLFGDPESGKTFVALAAVAETLRLGRRALVLDLDHNGPTATVARLLTLGAPVAALRDLERFRYVEPEDRWEVTAVVEDCQQWEPAVVVVDSIGELLPVFGASSNSPDDFTTVHTRVMKPLAMAGACVVCIDHLAKNSESRTQGATGTAAKRRAIGGTSIRVKVTEPFVPGSGGSAHLLIHKDRHGGLRRESPVLDREPIAGTFTMTVKDGTTRWQVTAPTMGERNPEEIVAGDVAALAALDPPPHSGEDARQRLSWRKTRALNALKEWRRQGSHSSSASAVPGSLPLCREPGTAAPPSAVPGSLPLCREPGTAPCTACGEAMTFIDDDHDTHPGCAA